MMTSEGEAVTRTEAPRIPITRWVRLNKECELRVEVRRDSPLRLRLIDGKAEIFGSQIELDVWMTFHPLTKFAVFTWHGAIIEIDGPTETDSTSKKTPMISYVNLHGYLNDKRNSARESCSDSDASQGPRVIIVGPTDSGKSTLSKMLLSWAAKLGWIPTFVDLDVSQGSISMPGCIAATPVGFPIHPVEEIPFDLPAPLVYFHGHATASANVDLYKVLMKELAQVLERRFAASVRWRASGMVINTMGWVDGVDYELLLHAIDTFNASVVVVLGQEDLGKKLDADLSAKVNVRVVQVQKSDGVVTRNDEVRHTSMALKIREYFCGPSNRRAPPSKVVNFSDIDVYRIGARQAPHSALPGPLKWVDGVDYELLLRAIDTFNASVVGVLGQEDLGKKLDADLSAKVNVRVAQVQKSDGVVTRNEEVRHTSMALKIREYFYGPSNRLAPPSKVVNFSDIDVYKIGAWQAPHSALPEPVARSTELIKVIVDQDLLHRVLAVSDAHESNKILSSRKISYLAPYAGNVPLRYLIKGSCPGLNLEHVLS